MWEILGIFRILYKDIATERYEMGEEGVDLESTEVSAHKEVSWLLSWFILFYIHLGVHLEFIKNIKPHFKKFMLTYICKTDWSGKDRCRDNLQGN